MAPWNCPFRDDGEPADHLLYAGIGVCQKGEARQRGKLHILKRNSRPPTLAAPGIGQGAQLPHGATQVCEVGAYVCVMAPQGAVLQNVDHLP